MGEAVVLDVAALVAQRLELGQPVGGARPVGDPAGLDLGQRRLQRRIFQRHVGVALEVQRGGFHRRAIPWLSSRLRRSPAWLTSPASTSATWRAWMPEPIALEAAGHVHQAAQVAGQHQVGAGGRDVLDLVRDHPGRDLGILDAERAAEPAADLALVHLEQAQPVDTGQELARLALDLELAQARAAVVIGGGRRRTGPRPRARHGRRPGSSPARGSGRPARPPAPSSPGRRRTAPAGGRAACRRRSPRGPRHSRSRRRPRSGRGPAPRSWRDRRS